MLEWMTADDEVISCIRGKPGQRNVFVMATIVIPAAEFQYCQHSFFFCFRHIAIRNCMLSHICLPLSTFLKL